MIELKPKQPFYGFRWEGYPTSDSDMFIKQGAAQICETNWESCIYKELYINGKLVSVGDWVIVFPDGSLHVMENQLAASMFTKGEKK